MTDPLTTLASIEQKADKADTLKACKCGGFVSLDERIRLGTITVDGYKASCQCGCSLGFIKQSPSIITALTERKKVNDDHTRKMRVLEDSIARRNAKIARKIAVSKSKGGTK